MVSPRMLLLSSRLDLLFKVACFVVVDATPRLR